MIGMLYKAIMSNYRAQYSQNLSYTELFKFTILVLWDTFYLNTEDLILQSYFNTFTHVNIKRLGELTYEESWRRSILKVEGGLFWNFYDKTNL